MARGGARPGAGRPGRKSANTSPLSRGARARARDGDGNQRPWPADKVERWSIDRLIPYAKNARVHTDEIEAQQLRVPPAPGNRKLIVSQDIGPLLRLGPACSDHHRDLDDAELPGGEHASMARNQTAVLAHQRRRRPAPLLDACRDGRNLRIRVGAGILRIRDRGRRTRSSADACARPRARRRRESKTVAGGQGRALGDRAADPLRKKCQGPHGCPGRRDSRHPSKPSDDRVATVQTATFRHAVKKRERFGSYPTFTGFSRGLNARIAVPGRLAQ
jgi:hypothetical protein